MRHIVRYRYMTIPNKVIGELRITVEDRQSEYRSMFDGGKATNLTLYPIVHVQLLPNQASEVNDAGLRTRVPWDINDSIGLTKFTLPIFINEFKEFYESMKTPDLYSYRGERLELNDSVATKVRKVFIISTTTIEFTAAVLVDQNNTLLEGMKMKFNNEKSSVLLTLNEMTAILYNLTHLEVDALSLMMYTHYARTNETDIKSNARKAPVVDITDVPVEKTPRVSAAPINSQTEFANLE